MNVLKVLSVRRFICGYELRTEIWDSGCSANPEIQMIAAYTPSGDYIGDSKWAHRLVVKRGIQPQKSTPDHNVCSIGYSVKDGKWYGWSHRAIFGFKVGSTCKEGDCHYRPKNKRDFREDMKRFWSDPGHCDVRAAYHTEYPEDGGDAMEGVRVSWKYDETVKNKSLHHKVGSAFSPYPDDFGKGSWTAKTTVDAKRMAIDFAAGVS